MADLTESDIMGVCFIEHEEDEIVGCGYRVDEQRGILKCQCRQRIESTDDAEAIEEKVKYIENAMSLPNQGSFHCLRMPSIAWRITRAKILAEQRRN